MEVIELFFWKLVGGWLRLCSTKGGVKVQRLDAKYTRVGVVDSGEHLEGSSVHKANLNWGLTLRQWCSRVASQWC